MIYQINFLYILIFLIIFQLCLSNDLPFPEDNECEKLNSLIINRLLYNLSLPENISSIYKILKYSGSGMDDLGDYYGCMQLSDTNYYKISISISIVSTSIGICYYKTCNITYFNETLKKMINYFNQTLPIFNSFNISIPENDLEIVRDSNRIGAIIVLTILLSLFIFCIYSTIINKKSLIMFNLEKNSQIIFGVRNSNKTYEYLRVFDGIRFFSAAWIVYGHLCSSESRQIKSLMRIYSLARKWSFASLLASFYAVDVFFFMSGFLFYFGSVKYFNKNISRLKLISIGILNRWLRLFPFMIFTILGITYLLPFMSNGPQYNNVGSINKYCKKYWWHNLIYINNLMSYKNESMCAAQTWYLGCDMQFFLISILIVFIFNNNKIMRHICFISILIFSTFIQMYWCIKYKYTYNQYITHEKKEDDKKNSNDDKEQNNFFQDFYIHPFARIPAYIIGIYFCIFFMETNLYKNDYENNKKENIIQKDDSNKISYGQINYNESLLSENIKKNESLLYKINCYIENNNYIVFILFIIGLLLLNFSFWTSTIANIYQLTNLENALLNTFDKILFVTGMGIVLHLVYLKKFSFIKTLLTFKFMTTISRSTYGIYMLHLYFISLFFSAYDNNYYVSLIDFVFLNLGIFIFSWIVSFVIGLIIESPLIGLSKKFLRNEKNDKKNKEIK